MSLIGLIFAAALVGEAPQEATAPALPPIGQLADEGVETYRAEFERLTGRAYPDRLGETASTPTVIFERRPGETPRVIVLAAGRRMEGPVSEVAWERVKRQGRVMADVVGPHDQSPGGDPNPVCIGPMLYTTIEMTPERARAPDGTQWRRWRELAGCGYALGLIGGFGDDMARIALELLPPCDSLTTTATDPNPSRTLAQCVWLDGDRLAAVQFLNERRLRPRRTYVDARDWRDWRDWFGQGEPEIEWPGYAQWLEERDSPPEDSEQSDQSVFVAEQAAPLENLSIWYTSIRGDSAGQVTTRGFITGIRRGGPGGDDDVDVIAMDEQVWEGDGGWSLRSWRVGPFRPQDENGQ